MEKRTTPLNCFHTTQSICNYVVPGTNVSNICELKCIDRNKGLYRAKVNDPQQRKSILDNAKKLRESNDFKDVFLNRDLTFRQRQDLMERRAELRNSQAAALQVQGAAAPSGSESQPQGNS